MCVCYKSPYVFPSSPYPYPYSPLQGVRVFGYAFPRKVLYLIVDSDSLPTFYTAHGRHIRSRPQVVEKKRQGLREEIRYFPYLPPSFSPCLQKPFCDRNHSFSREKDNLIFWKLAAKNETCVLNRPYKDGSVRVNVWCDRAVAVLWSVFFSRFLPIPIPALEGMLLVFGYAFARKVLYLIVDSDSLPIFYTAPGRHIKSRPQVVEKKREGLWGEIRSFPYLKPSFSTFLQKKNWENAAHGGNFPARERQSIFLKTCYQD
jgi:hypothetical protein